MGAPRKRHWSLLPPLELAIYLVFRAIALAIQVFPHGQRRTVGHWLGIVLRLVDRRHARIARRNVELAPGAVAPPGIPRFLDRVYDSIGLGLVELLLLPRLGVERAIKRWVRLERFDLLDRILERGRGAIVAIGHTGNWELVGLAVARAGYPLSSLARSVVNSHVNRYFARVRTGTGQEIISSAQAFPAMARTLRRNGMLVIQVDLDAKRSGVRLDFLGRPASVERSPALLALRCGTPILVADIFREGDLHRCIFSDPIEPAAFRGHPDPVRALTAQVTVEFERCVRRHPEQWFWILDRWRYAEKHPEFDSQAPKPVRV